MTCDCAVAPKKKKKKKTGAGKTSLHTRFLRDEFHQQRCTIGLDFGVRTIVMCGQIIKLQGLTTSSRLRFLVLLAGGLHGGAPSHSGL